MTRLLIRNGRVVDPSQGLDEGMDILLEDGCVAALGERLRAVKGTPVLDASDLVVAPGFIDLHCHLREPGAEHKETIASGLRAAAAGGYTAVCAMADSDPANDDPAVTRYVREMAEEVDGTRLYPIGAISKGRNGEAMAEIGEMVDEGAVAFSDADRPVSNALLLRRALEYALSFDVPIVSYPMDPDLADGGSMHEGAVSTRIGLRGLPAAAEEIVVARDILIAESVRGRLHLCHLSTGASLDLVRSAKQKGFEVSCDVAPHHFILTDEDVAASNYDPNWKTYPPLRSAAEVEGVLQAIYDGTVDAIASDHSPHHADEKELDFGDAPFGVIGLETTVGLAVDRLLHGKVIGISQLVRLLSTGPAEVLGLPGGSLREGEPADLTLLDLRKRWTVNPAKLLSKARNTPFAGRRLKGAPVATIVGGKVIWQSSR
ncbi:MAG: dihydroorotase [Thermoanaerobaculales bacterium]|nr:dihydroorotase [Thermoanaerobaculales bacterium]